MQTVPMTTKGTTVRSAAYHRQNGAVRLTPRQLRRMEKKYRRTLRPRQPNPHYHCSTLDRTPCPTGEHRNPATHTERPALDA